LVEKTFPKFGLKTFPKFGFSTKFWEKEKEKERETKGKQKGKGMEHTYFFDRKPFKKKKERKTGLTFFCIQDTLVNVKNKSFHGEFDPGSG
jgi:hypothetical protein